MKQPTGSFNLAGKSSALPLLQAVRGTILPPTLKTHYAPLKCNTGQALPTPRKLVCFSAHWTSIAVTSVIYALQLIPHLFTASYDLLQSFYQEKAISESEMKEVQRIILATYPDQNKLPALVTDPDKKGLWVKIQYDWKNFKHNLDW